MAGIWDYNNRFVQSSAGVLIPTTLSLKRTYRLNNWGNLSINEMYRPKRHLMIKAICKGIRIPDPGNVCLWNPES